ncbi:helix-turn-helix domain-containing protein [Nonomuraea sp. H19]|uniref:helix-turn-helix domain-containing protein n=1 Tax=Nonomuraea sp. H19 TaxID=3452206 RepID=UPI003F8CD08B
MDRAEGAEELAAALAQLKQRSGLSYQELAARVYTSGSTLHRYCNGKGTPGDYDIVARIAKECGAQPDEMNWLVQCWKAARGEGAEPDTPDAVPRESPQGPPNELPRLLPRALETPETRRARRTVLVTLLMLTLLWTAVASIPVGGGTEELGWAAYSPAGSTPWAGASAPIDPALFGVTMNSNSGAMPTFGVGALRFWDSETRWSQLEPARGRFDWSTLDRLLDGAERAGLPTLFVFGGTPAWAAPAARKAAYPDGSRAAPPDDLDDWDAFVRALVRHAGSRIDAYELWVMANHRHHYNGSVETLVEMTRRATDIIRRADKHAVVVCPSVTELWKAQSHEFLRRFAELGGYQHCDVAGVKLYQRRVQDPPETMLEAIEKVDRTFHRAGLHPPVWNTGTTQSLPLNDPLEQDRAADYAVRFYLTGLYARKFNLRRMYFYAWGNGTIPIVLQAEDQPPTRAGRQVEQVQRWLTGADLRSCGRGWPIGMPRNVWQCEFHIKGHDGRRRTARVRWAISAAADTPAGAEAERVEYLDGTARAVGARDTVRVTERPLLIVDRAGVEPG